MGAGHSSETQLHGLWRIPLRHWYGPGAQTPAHFHPPTLEFFYDGHTVTIKQLPDKGWLHPSVDHFYRLRADWRGNDLLFLPPAGDWVKLVTLRNGFFEVMDSGSLWVYERVQPSDYLAEEHPFVQPRDLYRYPLPRRRPDFLYRRPKALLPPAGTSGEPKTRRPLIRSPKVFACGTADA